MMLDEFIANHYEDGEIYSYDDNISFQCIDHGHDVVDMKRVFRISIYQLVGTDEYFEITEIRDNSGYWQDGESYEPEFRKVFPVKSMVEITTWESV